MFKNKIEKKVIILLLAVIIVLSSVCFTFVGIKSFINTNYPASADLAVIEHQEKDEVTQLINALNTKDNNSNSGVGAVSANTEEITIERYLTLKDHNSSEKYLYTEYNGEGYAIYDRIGKFIYEKSQFGKGPFDKFFDDEKLYYGGPSEFYIKENNAYRHVETDLITSQSELEEQSAGLEYVRANYVSGENTELALAGVAPGRRDFYLGEKQSDEVQGFTSFYFPMISMYYRHYNDPTNNTFTTYAFGTEGHPRYYKDSVCGNNLFGSCAFVSLAMVMLYYDRAEKADMVPTDISGFNIMYDYNVKSNDYYVDDLNNIGRGKLSLINKNDLKSEFLHQKLIYNTFPTLRNKSTSELENLKGGSPFGYQISNLGAVYNNFATEQNLGTQSYSYRKGTYLLPESIVDGNPCILSLGNGYPHQSKPDVFHAAVASSFSGTFALWYTVDSVTCNYGWLGNSQYAEVDVNANFIDGYGNFNIYQ